MVTTRFVRRDDTAIAYDRIGSGDALVLLHAGLGDRRMWDDQSYALGARFEVIRIDARGFGETRQTETPYSSVNDVLAVLDDCGIQQSHVLGLSMGSATALAFALAHPTRMRSLILVGAGIGVPASPTLRANWAEVDRLMEDGKIDDANELEMQMWFDGPTRAPENVNSAARQRLADMNRALLTRDDAFDSEFAPVPPVEERLGDIGCPTLVMWGDSDIDRVQEAGPMLTQKLPNAKSMVLKNTAHIPNMEHPAMFNALVLEFLSGLE
ncbi:MAG TPA: alpha/beta fold hydrolase [Thermomicrobiales bacterium]|nr:alpha/beta fold hydrolase [Thermomicrobiales bacterium]